MVAVSLHNIDLPPLTFTIYSELPFLPVQVVVFFSTCLYVKNARYSAVRLAI